jgi:hypothetical protein
MHCLARPLKKLSYQYTTRKQSFTGRKKRPQSEENRQKIKKSAYLAAVWIGRKHSPAVKNAIVTLQGSKNKKSSTYKRGIKKNL